MAVVVEANVGKFELAALLNEDSLRTVDHDFSDTVVIEQRNERTKTEQLIADVVNNLKAIRAGQGISTVGNLSTAVNRNDILDLFACLFTLRQQNLLFGCHL